MGGFTGSGGVPMLIDGWTSTSRPSWRRSRWPRPGRCSRAPQAEDACWADVHMPDGTVRAGGRPEATSLGLCAEHRVELFGLEAS
jgi:hypothetical protein